jgi:hypothetical protein
MNPMDQLNIMDNNNDYLAIQLISFVFCCSFNLFLLSGWREVVCIVFGEDLPKGSVISVQELWQVVEALGRALWCDLRKTRQRGE